MNPHADPRGPTSSIEARMRAFVAGDVHAFESLFRELSPRVNAFIRCMGNDPRTAEDLTQQTFLKVHRARDTWQTDAPLLPWVFAIARRTFLDHKRQIRRRKESLSSDGVLPERSDQSESESSSAYDPLDETQQRQLSQTLASLPAPQREAIVLLKIQGLSTAEAAAVAGTTAGAIKLRAHRAYETLRRALGLK